MCGEVQCILGNGNMGPPKHCLPETCQNLSNGTLQETLSEQVYQDPVGDKFGC